MDALITAGGAPQPGESLYEYTRGQYKALLDIAGKPMIQWVLDALESSNSIDRVVMIGLPADAGVTCSKLVDHLPSQGTMVDNIRTGVNKLLEFDPTPRQVLVISSDIPALKSEMVDWVVETALQTDDDAYYNVITREVMEKRFPASKRSYTHLKGMDVCGGDMNLIKTTLVSSNDAIWDALVAARKSVLKQAALIGYDTLILLLLRWITLEEAVQRASRRLKIKGRAIVCPYAEVGMDVDKPHQLEMMRADLARQAGMVQGMAA